MSPRVHTTSAFVALLLLAAFSACGEAAPARPSAPAPRPEPARPPSVTLTLAAFTTAREAYEKRILPGFASFWQRSRGQEVRFEQSYEASADQVARVVAGLEADVVALSLAEDVDRLVETGLIRHEWRTPLNGGVASRSMVVLVVRKGNPRGIREWTDLARPGVRIVTPEPQTSGGGRWNVVAVYGSALRGSADSRNPAVAERLLAEVLRNVVSREIGARESFKKFLDGTGDVAITSESELVRARMFGHDCEAVVPRATLRIENPVAVVDANVDAHGVREVAEAFRDFLLSREAQSAFAFCGLRPVDPEVARESVERFPEPEDLWTIDDLGGWARVSKDLFGPRGVVERAEAAAGER